MGPTPVPPRMKTGFIVAAVVLLFIGFGVEYAGPKLPAFGSLLPDEEKLIRIANRTIDQGLTDINRDREADGEDPLEPDSPEVREAKRDAREQIANLEAPGYALEADGLFLWVVLFSILVSLIGMVAATASVIRGGMVASAVSSVIVIILSVALIVMAIIELTIMIGLLMALPFGPLIYLGIYGNFPKGVLMLVAGVGLLCKAGAALLVFMGGPQLARMKSSVLMFVTAVGTFFIMELVFGIVPGPFAGIADGILGIIFAVVAIVWAVVVLSGAIKGLTSKVS